MVTVASSPRPLSAVEINTETKYLKIAKKGGGHKGWQTYKVHLTKKNFFLEDNGHYYGCVSHV